MSTIRTNRFENTSGVAYGTVLQIVHATYTPYTSTAATIPGDDTIPQITEGFQILSASITPKSATNKLKITVNALLSNSAIVTSGCALFQDSNANAIAASTMTVGAAGWSIALPLTCYITAGTTSLTTFTVRVGATGGTTYINGNTVGRYYGGIGTSNITIEEIQV